MSKILFAILLCLTTFSGYCQQKEFTFNELNDMRIVTNKRANYAYTSLALVNVVGNLSAAAIVAPSDAPVLRPFFFTNIAWGFVQGVSAINERKRIWNDNSRDFDAAYKSYAEDMSRYRYRIFKDVGLMALGSVVAVAGSNSETLVGIGASTAAQGILLIIIDGIVYASHNSKMMKWARAMQIQTSGNTIGLSYTF